MANCTVCEKLRTWFINRHLAGNNVRLKFKNGDPDRVEFFIRRQGKWLDTDLGRYHLKDIQNITQEQ